jgi:hypothetical protein
MSRLRGTRTRYEQIVRFSGNVPNINAGSNNGAEMRESGFRRYWTGTVSKSNQPIRTTHQLAQDIRQTEKVFFVMKEGVIHRDDRAHR